MKRVLLYGVVVAAMSAVVLAAGQAPPDPIRIHLFTAPVEFVDGSSQQRADSLADLRKHLQGKKGILLVEDRTQADIVVEVLSRGYEPTGREHTTSVQMPVGRTTSSTTTKDERLRLRAQLTAGTYTLEIVGEAKGLLWREAAKRAGNQILGWVQQNRERLIAARGGR